MKRLMEKLLGITFLLRMFVFNRLTSCFYYVGHLCCFCSCSFYVFFYYYFVRCDVKMASVCILSLDKFRLTVASRSWLFRCVQHCGQRPAVPISASVRLRRRSGMSSRFQHHIQRSDRRVRRLRQNAFCSHCRLIPHYQGHRLATGAQPHSTNLRCVD